MSGSTQPTLAGFQSFIANQMGISQLYLPTDSPVIAYAYAVAISIVNPALALACGPSQPGLPAISIYALAVYNLAGDNVINFAQDQEGRTYFADARAKLSVGAFAPGVTASSADQSTSQSTLNPEFMKNLTLANLQNLKTQWGRQYLMFAQAYGPSIWGIS